MSDSDNFDLGLFFAALADKTRLRLINLIGDDEVCVCFFAEVFGTNQPKISRHLAYLKKAGLVAARRDGKWMHYQLTPPPDKRAAGIFNEIRLLLKDDAVMQRDCEKLISVCCAPISLQPISIKSAPRPKSVVR